MHPDGRPGAVASYDARMLRAVLFDFGGVILSSPFEAFARFEVERDLPAGFLRQVNATNPDGNAWARLERSELDFEQFGVAFASESAALGHEVDGREVLGMLSGDVRPAMVEALRRCHESLKTAMLTNNFVTSAGQRSAGPQDAGMGVYAQILELFDVIIESSKAGVRKPDPRFYEMACEELGIEPSEAVFLDDLGINLKPARAMGMQTIKVEDPAVAIAELEAIVGFPLG
jgi:putative hydrolase of the HAD superfamily